MSRSKHTDPPKHMTTVIPTSLWAKVQLELYSEVEGKVPFGALRNLIVGLLQDWLRSRGVEP